MTKDKWKEIKLKDLCTKIQYGYTASAINKNTGIKLLRITDIVPSKIEWESVPFCEISKTDIKKYLLEKDDIVIARTGATVGYAKALNYDVPKSVFASYLVKIVLNKEVDKRFVGILLTSDIYKSFITTIAGGAAQPNANANDLTSFKFMLPPLPIQQKIAAILSAYDDLIENNNRRIAILEEMAQQIYKEWFVRMRFPGWESAEFRKGMPYGWKIGKIGDICKIGRGSSPRPINDQRFFINGKIPWVKIADATSSGKFLYETKEYVNEFGASFSRHLKRGALIIATSGTLGFCQFLGVDACIHDGWLYTYDYNKIEPKFLYFVINSNKEYYNMISYGAAIQNINTDILRQTTFLLPSQNVLDNFQNIIKIIDEEIDILSRTNINLRKTRELLLPRLMSGKLSVEKIEKQTNNMR